MQLAVSDERVAHDDGQPRAPGGQQREATAQDAEGEDVQPLAGQAHVRLIRASPAPQAAHWAGRSRPAVATARSTAIDLLTDSSYSVVGTESATMPAPACT